MSGTGSRLLLKLSVTVVVWLLSAGLASAASGWRLVPTPAVGSADGDAALKGVSCISVRACVAVGYDTRVNPVDFSTVELPLAERWDGRRWSVQSVPNVPGAHTTALGAVSCGSPVACVAVGFAARADGAGSGPMLVERWSGATWVVQSLPLPHGARPGSGRLSSVSCRASVCTAVGSYTGAAGSQTALVERWNGSRWSAQGAAKPRAAKQSTLEELSCPGQRACLALGNYTDRRGVHTLVESWSGGRWLVKPAPPAQRRTGYGGLSCTSLRACMTVGARSRMLAERWDGTTWSPQSLVRPKGSLDSRLDAVSCISANDCTAVGSAETPFIFHQGAGSVAVAERWTGHEWRLEQTRNVGDINDGGQNELADVSCRSGKDCIAVGRDLPTRGTTLETLAEQWRGS